MKKYLIIAAVAAAGLWYFASKKKAATAAAATAGAAPQNRATTALWYGGAVNAANLKATTDSMTTAFDSLKTISNAFGFNWGGNGVSVAGSAAGGTQSSGSGAGLPSSGGGSIVAAPSLGDTGNGYSGYSDTSYYDDLANA